jgi:hypothetical protein
MVKQSKPKSTRSKKSTPKKKATPRRSAPKSGAIRKGVKEQKKAGKKVARPKKAAARPKAKARPKAAPKAKKAVAPKKAKVSIKDLLFKQFDTGVKGRAAKAPRKAAIEIPAAPPFVTGYDAKETERIRALLFKKFDLTETVVEKMKDVAPVEEAREPIPPAAPASLSSGRPRSGARGMMLGLGALVFLVAIIIAASLANRDKFYLKDTGAAIEVWRGKFAPTGAELVISLDGMKIPNPIHDVYSEKEAFGIVYEYFQDKADTALNEPEGPDFGEVNRYLRQAASYAPTVESREMIQRRLDGISFLVLLHRTDVALAKGRLPDLTAAQTHLAKAASYASMDYQRELVEKRRFIVEKAIAALVAQ